MSRETLGLETFKSQDRDVRDRDYIPATLHRCIVSRVARVRQEDNVSACDVTEAAPRGTSQSVTRATWRSVQCAFSKLITITFQFVYKIFIVQRSTAKHVKL